MSETTVAWWERYGRWGATVPRAWVVRIARLRLRSLLRAEYRRVRRTADAGIEPTPCDLPEQAVERAEVLARVLRVTLTPVDASILVLWLHDVRSPKIAEHVDLSPAAVRKRLERTLARMRSVALSGDSRARCHTSPRSSEL